MRTYVGVKYLGLNKLRVRKFVITNNEIFENLEKISNIEVETLTIEELKEKYMNHSNVFYDNIGIIPVIYTNMCEISSVNLELEVFNNRYYFSKNDFNKDRLEELDNLYKDNLSYKESLIKMLNERKQKITKSIPMIREVYLMLVKDLNKKWREMKTEYPDFVKLLVKYIQNKLPKNIKLETFGSYINILLMINKINEKDLVSGYEIDRLYKNYIKLTKSKEKKDELKQIISEYNFKKVFLNIIYEYYFHNVKSLEITLNKINLLSVDLDEILEINENYTKKKRYMNLLKYIIDTDIHITNLHYAIYDVITSTRVRNKDLDFNDLTTDVDILLYKILITDHIRSLLKIAKRELKYLEYGVVNNVLLNDFKKK